MATPPASRAQRHDSCAHPRPPGHVMLTRGGPLQFTRGLGFTGEHHAAARSRQRRGDRGRPSPASRPVPPVGPGPRPAARSRSSASSSQPPTAAASASASPGGTRIPGRRPPAAWPSASGTPPTAVAITGSPARQRLGDDHPVALVPRRQHQQVRRGIGPVELRPDQRPRQVHALRQPALGQPPPLSVHEIRVPVQVACADAGPRPRRTPGQLGERRESTSCPLAALTAPTQSSAPPVGVPTAASADVTPGGATSSPAGARSCSVVKARPVAWLVAITSRAARQHRAGRCPRRLRHVHHRHQPQPGGVPDQLGGGHPAQQPVDDDDPARPGCRRARGRPRRRFRCAATARRPERVDDDRPAETDEPGAGPRGRRRCHHSPAVDRRSRPARPGAPRKRR